MRVLLIAEEHCFVTELSRGLGALGCVVETGPGAASDISRCHEVGVVVMDLMHPRVDALDLCGKVREVSLVPIVLVSSLDDEMDRVLGLKLGADDFVVRPFGMREMAARLEAVVRRATGTWDRTGSGGTAGGGLSAPIRIDRRGRNVRVRDRAVNLTRKEFDILALLASEPGRVFEREDIMTEVWGHDGAGDTRTLGVHMVGLRRKLGAPSVIQTVRGIGFRLVPEHSVSC